MFIYSELLYHVLISYNNKHFMHQPLVWLLRVSKDKCDEYTVCQKIENKIVFSYFSLYFVAYRI